jgi:DNA-binding transcriptional LysR family regulator
MFLINHTYECHFGGTMDINFELYKIFYHAASAGSFSEAAKRLYISQSAVSQSVAGLEQKIGSPLFLRRSRKISLTSEGELLFRHIEQAFNFIKAGEGKLSEMRSLGLGEIRIGVGDTNCRYFLVPFLENFIKLYPKIKFKVVNRTSPQILENLRSGQIDIGIVTLPSRSSSADGSKDSTEKDLHFSNLDDMNLKWFKDVRDVFVASSRYSELKDRTISLNELASYPLLLLRKESGTRRNLDSCFSSLAIDIMPEIELESIDLLVEFARIGLGVAHVLYESAEELIESGELFEVGIEEKFPDRSLAVATMKNVPLSKAASEFHQMLRQ